MNIKRILIFFVISLNILAANLGENIISNDLELYFNSKSINIYDINNPEIEKLKLLLNRYKTFKEIDLESFLDNKEYAISLNSQDKFFMVIKLSSLDFLSSDFYNNPELDNRYLNDINTYYNLGDEPYIYSYTDNKLYISNDISLFFDLFNGIKGDKDLQHDEIFQKLSSQNEEYQYRYYLKNKGLKEIGSYLVKEKAVLVSKQYEKSVYNIIEQDKSKLEPKLETINFSDYISRDNREVIINQNLESLKEDIIKDFKLLEDRDYEIELLEEVKNRGEVIAIEVLNEIIPENKDRDYFIIYLNKGLSKIYNKIIDKYNDVFFYEKVYQVKGNSIEIPLLNIKRYMKLINKNYLVITKSKEVLNDIEIGKYYNYKYSYVGNDGMIYQEEKSEPAQEKDFEVKDGLLIKVIDRTNTENN